tara:strand:- start:522 stop:1256 length:735 start_codon:yes stop_codon:yes gene_type:complete
MKKLILLITILIISSYLFIVFVSDNLIKNVLQKNISTSLNRNVSIEKLNINYFKGEADIKEIQLSNKEFAGYLINIKNIKVRLDAFSIFSNNILIRNILLKDIRVNYYFNYDGLKILDNVRSFQKDLGNKTSNSHSNKYFNIENLDAKNISLAVLSPDLNFEKTFTLNDMNFRNIGNANTSKNYKDILKEIFKDTMNTIEGKVLNDNILNELQNYNPKLIEDKVKQQINKKKDKLKNKLKELLN